MTFPFDASHTAEDLTRLRAASVLQTMQAGTPVTVFTCDTCPQRHTCSLVFDPYNTDGDCLADK